MTRVLKVCINPDCEEVAHNCAKKEKRCRSCQHLLCEITREHYMKHEKWYGHPIQIDYETDERTTPGKQGYKIISQRKIFE